MMENDCFKILIETKDLILKKGEFDDWKPLFRNIWSRNESAKYMLWRVTGSEEEAKERMVRTLDYQKKEKYALLVYLKADMEPIGFAAMQERESKIYEEMGIAIGPEFVGKGYGKQILNALCMEAKAQGAKEFRASYREKNLASKGLLNSCGFEFDYLSEEKTDPRSGERYFVVNEKKILTTGLSGDERNRTLYVGFKGKNNSSGKLAQSISPECLLLTNSYDGLKREIDSIGKDYDQVVMFGVDKTLSSMVRIEKTATRDGERNTSNLNLDELMEALNLVGMPSVISEAPATYLCNDAYWHMLRKYSGNVVFIHIPTIKHADDEFNEKMRLALLRYYENW